MGENYTSPQGSSSPIERKLEVAVIDVWLVERYLDNVKRDAHTAGDNLNGARCQCKRTHNHDLLTSSVISQSHTPRG
jgi:hypothetical protein